ncbi:MAG: flagellar basal body rod C-terminal domain-containing protein [Sphingomonadales bacterium]
MAGKIIVLAHPRHHHGRRDRQQQRRHLRNKAIPNRQQQIGADGTIEAALDADLAAIGAGVGDAKRLEASAARLKEDAARANDAVSAVDLETEAAELTRLQAAYRANAQVIGVARDLFDQILGLVR